MSNSLVGNVWHVDTVGVLTSKPVWVTKVVLFPNANTDAALFNYANVGSAKSDYINSGPTSGTATVTGTNTITATGLFPATDVAVGDFLHVANTASGNNIGDHIVITRSSNDAIVTAGGLTNEASVQYLWTIYNGYRAFYLKGNASTVAPVELSLGDVKGQWFPNLALYTLSSSATVDIYMRPY